MQVINGRRGFTLVEVIVVLAVLSILVAFAVPAALRIFQVTAEEGTRDEMLNLKEAMIGNPDKLRGNVRSDFAFLGDIGRLPTNLDELLVRGALPAFTFDSAKQAGAGWNGPYITGSFAGEELEDFKKDQLGNPYVYSDADFTNGNGELADGKITSAGPDGTIGTVDDIVLELVKNETTGTIRGTVKDTAGNSLTGVPVDLNFASNGSLSTVTATSDSNGSYTFTSVPFGPRSVQANSTGFFFVQGSIISDDDDIQFDAANLRSTPAVIDQMSVVFSVGLPTCVYNQIQIDNDTVDIGSNFVSGELVDLRQNDIDAGDTTFAAGSRKSSLRVTVDNVDSQLPDIIISPGTARTVEIKNFRPRRDCDPRGFPITINFFESGVAAGVVSFVP